MSILIARAAIVITMARSSLTQRLRDPYFYLVDFDFEEEMMVFALSEPAHFLQTLRITAYDFPRKNLKWVPFQRVYEEIDWNSHGPSINYLFHLPFCGSTLLTRYLESSSFLLRDPVALDAIYIKGQAGTKFPPSISRLRRATLKLLNRPLSHRGTVIRTAGYYPEMFAPLVSSPTFRSCIFLFSSPQYYLAQVLKSPERRKHVRCLFSRRRQYARLKTKEKLESLTDSALVMLSWIFAVESLVRLVTTLHDKQIYTLDCEDFFANPRRAVRRVCNAFNLDSPHLDNDCVDRIGSRHSKSGQPFSAAQRRSEKREAALSYQAEIRSGLEFLNSLLPRRDLLARLKSMSI